MNDSPSFSDSLAEIGFFLSKERVTDARSFINLKNRYFRRA